MAIYISGKITAPTEEERLNNLKRFADKEKELSHLGLVVFNPAKFEDKKLNWEDYIARDVVWIYENRPDIYVMRDWEESRGARTEIALGKLLGLKIIYE